MFNEKIFEIIAITVPIFAITGVGKLLGKYEILSGESKKGISWITYYIALPSLIFGVFLKSDSAELFTTELLFLSLIPILVTGVLLFIFSSTLKISAEKKAATIYCSFWGNNGYMGIPLAASAIGATKGVALAAVINGMTVPIYIGLSVFLMIRAKDKSEHSLVKEIVKTLMNPVIIALIVGSIISFLHIPALLQNSGNGAVSLVYSVVVEILEKLGSMGLPLALILVGSNLNTKSISGDITPLTLTVIGKLMIAPATAFLAAKLFVPNLEKDLLIAVVLLNSVPGAVASYIISSKFDSAQEFVSSALVISTALSIFTIPFWLFWVL
jgi:malonate transporter